MRKFTLDFFRNSLSTFSNSLAFKSGLALCSLLASRSDLLAYSSYPHAYAILAPGYRQDKFHWSMAGEGGFPNVLAETKWRDLQIAELQLIAGYTTVSDYYFWFQGGIGRIYSGHARDSDYAENNRQFEYERTTANAGSGDVFDLSGGFGYRVVSGGGRLQFMPMVGYAHDEQHLKLFDGNQKINLIDPPPEGRFNGLHSGYNTRWYGPWAGFDLLLKLECNIKVFANGQFHVGSYRAKAHWNLMDETLLGDYVHKARFDGLSGTIGFGIDICHGWQIGALSTYRNYWTHKGKHTVRFAQPTVDDDGDLVPGEPEKAKLKLNTARWRSWGVALAIVRRF